MSMFTRKIESSNCCARTALMPRATSIETTAISSGMSPATTAPNTSSRMMSAAGRPNWSSPFSRSSWDRRLKSWSSVSSPVTDTAKAESSAASSAAEMTSAASSSSKIPSGTIVACRSSETSPSGPSRYVRASASGRSGLSETNVRTKVENSPESTVSSSERMTRMSLTISPGRGGNARKRTSSARSDCGLFVGAPSVVRSSNVAIAAIASTIATIHAPTTRQGWRALAEASARVPSLFMRLPPAGRAARARRPQLPPASACAG